MEVLRITVKKNDPVIIFEKVSKSYLLQNPFRLGFKTFLLNLRNYVKEAKYSKLAILNNVSFKILKGESVGIIGKNGAGKSTILSLIAGTIKPDSGNIFVKGKVVPILELGAGFHPELTGIENIILNGLILGMKKKEIVSKLERIIEFSELSNFIYQPIKTYSSGMIARLAFSIAVNMEPDILLIDEILAVGDFKFQQKCISKLLEFKKRGVTIVFVSHNENDIKLICDKVIVIHNSKKIFDGQVDRGLEIYKKILS